MKTTKTKIKLNEYSRVSINFILNLKILVRKTKHFHGLYIILVL